MIGSKDPVRPSASLGATSLSFPTRLPSIEPREQNVWDSTSVFTAHPDSVYKEMYCGDHGEVYSVSLSDPVKTCNALDELRRMFPFFDSDKPVLSWHGADFDRTDLPAHFPVCMLELLLY